MGRKGEGKLKGREMRDGEKKLSRWVISSPIKALMIKNALFLLQPRGVDLNQQLMNDCFKD